MLDSFQITYILMPFIKSMIVIMLYTALYKLAVKYNIITLWHQDGKRNFDGYLSSIISGIHWAMCTYYIYLSWLHPWTA